MDIAQLNYFISVAQTLNFTEAARRNGMTQPAISHHISELEKQLSCRLFLRNRKTVELTGAGQEFLPYAMEMVDLAEKASFQVRQAEKGAFGHLAIAALTTSSAVLSHCLSAFSRKYPDIFVDINFTSGRTQAIAMTQDKYDLHFAVREMVPHGETFEAIESNRDRLCLAFPGNHPMAGKEADFSKLGGERFIAVSESDGPTLYHNILNVCRIRGYEPNIIGQYDRAEAVLLSVGAGLGISIIPEALSRVFYAENVSFTPIPGADAERTYVIARRCRSANLAVQLFWNLVTPMFSHAV